MKHLLIMIGIFIGISAINACSPAVDEETIPKDQPPVSDAEEEAAALAEASIQLAEQYYDSIHAVLIDQKGNRVGVAQFTEVEAGVEIEVEGWDLPPGEHGFHIHEQGQCDIPSFESAGGHFNPTKTNHGFEHPEGPHAGDLPNIKVDEDGRVQTTIVAEMLSLQEGAKNSILTESGTSIMIHADPDDYQTDPAGDSGERIVCGTIQ